MFNNNIYNLESLVIYEYFLKSDFKFMIINNNKYYSKDSLFEFKKLSKFFCKTIITN
jgi:hypothetical protein